MKTIGRLIYAGIASMFFSMAYSFHRAINEGGLTQTAETFLIWLVPVMVVAGLAATAQAFYNE